MGEDGKTSGWDVLRDIIENYFLIALGLAAMGVGAAGRVPKLDLTFTGWEQWVVIVPGILLFLAGAFVAWQGRTYPPWKRKVKKWGIKVTFPRDNPQLEGESFRIEGECKKLPKNLQLGILEQSGKEGSGRYYARIASVEIITPDKWRSGPIPIREKKGNERIFIVVVMGKDAQAMFDYAHDVSGKIWDIYNEHSVPLGDRVIPGFKKPFISDMVDCETTVHMIEKAEIS
jgi:hypothetical protein